MVTPFPPCTSPAFAIFLALIRVASSRVLINEYQPNPSGTDPSKIAVEFKQTEGEQRFEGCLLVIECDSGQDNHIDNKADVALQFDDRGLGAVEIPDIENPSHVVALFSEACTQFPAARGDPFLTSEDAAGKYPAEDAIAVIDSTSDETPCKNVFKQVYGGAGSQSVFVTFSGGEPQLLFRDRQSNKVFVVNDPHNDMVFDHEGNQVSAEDFDFSPLTNTLRNPNPSREADSQSPTTRFAPAPTINATTSSTATVAYGETTTTGAPTMVVTDTITPTVMTTVMTSSTATVTYGETTIAGTSTTVVMDTTTSPVMDTTTWAVKDTTQAVMAIISTVTDITNAVDTSATAAITTPSTPTESATTRMAMDSVLSTSVPVAGGTAAGTSTLAVATEDVQDTTGRSALITSDAAGSFTTDITAKTMDESTKSRLVASDTSTTDTRDAPYTGMVSTSGVAQPKLDAATTDREEQVKTTVARDTTTSLQTTSSPALGQDEAEITVAQNAQTSSEFPTVSTVTESASTPEVVGQATSTAGVVTKEQVQNLLNDVEDATKSILKELRQSNRSSFTTVVASTGQTMFGVKLNTLGSNTGHIEVPVPPEVGMSVTLPASLFGSLGISAEEAVLAVSTVELPGVAAAAIIDVQGLRGNSIAVSGLVEPIAFSLPTKHDDRLRCAYWDEEAAAWSSKGVSSRARSKADDAFWCETKHLSLFSGIWEGIRETLECSNFKLFNSESVGQLSSGDWYTSPGAILCWCVLVLMAMTFLGAAAMDFHRSCHHGWTDEFFLVPCEDVEPRTSVMSSTHSDASVQQLKICSFLTCIYSCYAWLLGSSVLRDALDDIGSKWFAYFSEARSLLEGLFCCPGTNKDVTAHMILLVSHRMTAANLGVSYSLVDFVLSDEDLADFMVDAHSTAEERPRTPETHMTGFHTNWRTTDSQRGVWTYLRREICEDALQQTQAQGSKLGHMKTIFWLFMSHNPIGHLFLVDIFMNCKQRVLTLTSDILGSFALSCAFFATSGLVRGKSIGREACGGGVDSFGKWIGRFIVIAMGSLLLAGIPTLILGSLQTKCFKKIEGGRGSRAWLRQLRVWRLQSMMYWCFALLYNGFCVFYILLFLANIDHQDQANWSFVGVIATAQDLVITPFLVAMLIPTSVRLVLFVQTRLHKVDRNHVTRRACELLHRRSNVMLPIDRI